MNYSQLAEFLSVKMRMSHIYQPVMIKKLLQSGGRATDKEIAEVLLQYDPSQLEYYVSVTNNMVGKVLRGHKIVNRNSNLYELTNFKELSKDEIDNLTQLCDLKLDEYIQKRGDAIWNHRRVGRIQIPGSIRYEVLKRANSRCELCGISMNERALEVDHIEPLNLGGENSLNNYQALCYVCNANKGDRDNTDFRKRNEIYAKRDKGCIFCLISNKRIVTQNNLAYLIYDKYPVTSGHCLIIPKRHFSDYFEITQAEMNSIHQLIKVGKELNRKESGTVNGFNIGINNGKIAGQTILHTHIHLIPRRESDVENPVGGIRNIIPGKGDYIADSTLPE